MIMVLLIKYHRTQKIYKNQETNEKERCCLKEKFDIIEHWTAKEALLSKRAIDFILGMEIVRNRNNDKLTLDQRRYLEDIP